MDDLSFLVKQTYKHQSQDWMEDDEEGWEPEIQFNSLPQKPGLFFHVDHLGGTFVIRSLLSQSLAQDFERIKGAPEEYPSLRLLSDNRIQWHKLNHFECELFEEAEMLHQRLGMRRFPVKEESVCNISDPGFSLWFEKTKSGFTLHPKIKNLTPNLVRLGPLVDSKIAQRRWMELSEVMNELPLGLDLSLENGSLTFSSQESWLSEAVESVFSRGEFSAELMDVFKLLARRTKHLAQLETGWFFLQEVALARRFWIKVESELDYWS